MIKTCTIDGCSRPIKAKDRCQMHYSRTSHRPRPRSRPERLIYNRARNRAVAVLVDQHRPEFERLLALLLIEATMEAERLKASTGVDGSHLRAGPRPSDEPLEQRVMPPCELCDTHHKRGHTCPKCGHREGA